MGHVHAHALQRVHHGQDVGLKPARKRVGQHNTQRAAKQRHSGNRAKLVVNLFHVGEDAADGDHVVGLYWNMGRHLAQRWHLVELRKYRA